MFRWEILNKRDQKIIREMLSTELIIMSLIIFEIVISSIRALFFPSGNFTIDIIVGLDNCYSIYLMARLFSREICKDLLCRNPKLKRIVPTTERSKVQRLLFLMCGQKERRQLRNQ